MTSDTLYIKRPCGEGTNPDKNGYYFVERHGEKLIAFFDTTNKEWRHKKHIWSETLLLNGWNWLEPFTTIENIQEEAYTEGWKARGRAALGTFKWMEDGFNFFRKDWLKRNGGE